MRHFLSLSPGVSNVLGPDPYTSQGLTERILGQLPTHDPATSASCGAERTGGWCAPLSTLSLQKEILLRVLHYIQYLQRSIDVAKALLKLHNNRGGFVGEQFHLQCLYTTPFPGLRETNWPPPLSWEGDCIREVSKVL